MSKPKNEWLPKKLQGLFFHFLQMEKETKTNLDQIRYHKQRYERY